MYESNPVSVAHPCCADWDDPKNFQEDYQNLVFLQRHQCIGTCCLWGKKHAGGREYSDPYCQFRFPLYFQWTWSISFI